MENTFHLRHISLSLALKVLKWPKKKAKRSEAKLQLLLQVAVAPFIQCVARIACVARVFCLCCRRVGEFLSTR